jgi:hypothetical protein
MNWLLHGQCQSIIDAKLDCGTGANLSLPKLPPQFLSPLRRRFFGGFGYVD